MQHTYYPDDDNYGKFFPGKIVVKDVTVVYDPSLMACSHDYSCPICREKHAVLSSGIMQPCWECQKKGYRILRKNVYKKWWQFWKESWLMKWRD